MCSRARYANFQTTSGTVEYHDSSLHVVSTVHSTTSLSLTGDAFLKESAVPYENQNVGGAYPIDIAATTSTDFSTQAWSVTPQAPVCSPILCFTGVVE